jgi:flagellar M-ring protein FliF
MNSVGGEGSNQGGSLEEKTSYEADRKETKTVKARGEINRMTVSVAIDADLDAEALSQVQDIVSNAIGYDTDRGDSISVVAMNFDSNNDEQTAASIKEEMTQAMKTVGISVGGILILIAAILVFMLIKKKKAETYSELDDNEQLDMINKKIQEIEKARNPEEATEQNITLEEEVKQFAVANKDKVKDLINNWLNE